MSRNDRLRTCALALVALVVLAPAVTADAPTASRPSVLVHCPRASIDQWAWWVDLQYLTELQAAGFEVDYTDRHEDFTWERVQRYDVVVLATVPVELGAYYNNTPNRPPYRDEFVAIVERYLAAGGGVFLMAQTINADESFLPLIESWGARIAHERIVEDDPSNLAAMPRMRGEETLWYVDEVPRSPVSDGVEQVWLPFTRHYAAAETMPIVVDASWTVVLRGSSTSHTAPVESGSTGLLDPPRVLRRDAGVSRPDLCAIRSRGAGRIAFCAIWAQYSYGQGTQWLYERRVLSRGIGGRASDFGRLFENTLHWLAEPAQSAESVGGFVTDPERLAPPNTRAKVRRRWVERWSGTPADPQKILADRRGNGRLFRGVIGAHGGDVAAYAAAARRGGLDYVVFLERFAGLDSAALERLKQECARHSGPDLQLYPGYRIETNTGNRMFLFGPGVMLPPAALVIDGRLNLQYQDPASGEFGIGGSWIDWINYRVIATRQVNVGFYGFADRPTAMQIPDLRFYSMLGLRLYRGLERVEDNLDDYLLSAAGTIPPVPVAVNLVAAPAELERAAAEQIGLTWARASSLDDLWDALGYADAYRSPNVFSSDGPLIELWPETVQRHTFGAERYVTAAARVPAPLVVRSDVGLDEVRIYDGDRLFRRIAGAGHHELALVLELTASVQRNLVVVASDVAGGRAVSHAHRSWKGGGLAPVFCGDRVNHCRSPSLMAKGPGTLPVSVAPAIRAGDTWDGGPTGRRPIVMAVDALEPALVSNLGDEGHDGFANRARLILADEAAVRVSSHLETLYDPRIPVVNAWRTFGPLAGDSRLIRADVTLTRFNRPTTGPDAFGFPGDAERSGAQIVLFESELQAKRDLRVKSLRLFRQKSYPGPYPVVLMHGRDGMVLSERKLDARRRPQRRLSIDTGEWFAVYGPEPSNLSVHFNRGLPLRIRLRSDTVATGEAKADLDEKRVAAGTTARFELVSVVDPIDAPGRGRERVIEIVGRLLAPGGLEILRGTRLAGPSSIGIVEIETDSGVAALSARRNYRTAGLPLPLRAHGLNRNWSAGVWLREGYVLGNYGAGRDRYRAAAIDERGRAYALLHTDMADRSEIVIGHPVVCDQDALFIQVTRLDDAGEATSWHVSVNNPTETAIRATLDTPMDLPGLDLAGTTIDVPAGAYRVVR